MYQLMDVNYKNIIKIKELTIPSHKITCIVGKSGSGKSTLLRLLNKLNRVDSGEITFHQQSLSNIDSIELRRQVTMLSQIPIIYPGTIRDNLLIGLKFQDRPVVDDWKLNETLEDIQLNKKLDDLAEKLSGGEKQRLALGRILILEPDTLLLDEPSSALDDHTEDLVINKVVQYIKRNNKTLIMVTHSTSIADQYAEFLIEMSHGEITKTEVRR